MIVFHEGLPGSGKSYEAIIEHLLKSIQQGREVVTNIDGINHQYISQLLNIPLKFVEQSIKVFYDPDVEKQKEMMLPLITNDQMVIIDEIQNLFPSERTKLPDEWNILITEHRHRGLDFVLLGQDRRDCHNMWRRRIQRVVTFNKLSALGSDNSYRWEVYEATRPDKYKKVTSGVKKYDKQYFDCYSSHVAGTNNKTNYTDKRAIVWNTPFIKYGIPAFIVVLFYSVSHLKTFFSPESEIHVPTQVKREKTTVISTANASTPAIKVQPKEQQFQPLDSFDDSARQNSIRISLHYSYRNTDIYIIDVYNKRTNHLIDQYHLSDLESMGWTYDKLPNGLVLVKDSKKYNAVIKPLNRTFGSASNSTITDLRN